MRLILAVAGLIGAALPGLAADREWPSKPLQGQVVEQPPCTCRSPGGAIELGREVCLATPSGGRRARCVMVLNNTSWSIADEGCATVSQLTQ